MFDRSKSRLAAAFAIAAIVGAATPATAAVTFVESRFAQAEAEAPPLIHVASRFFVPSGHGGGFHGGGFHGGLGRGFSPGAGFGSRGFAFHGADVGPHFGFHGAGVGPHFGFHGSGPGLAFHGHGAGFPVAGLHRGAHFHGRRWSSGPSIFLDPADDLYDWDYDSDSLYEAPPQPARACQWYRTAVHDKHGKIVRGWDRWVQVCS